MGQDAREIAALMAQGWSVAAIADRVGLTERRVRQLLIHAAPGPAQEMPHRVPGAPAEAPPVPRRITRRTLVARYTRRLTTRRSAAVQIADRRAQF